MGNDAALPLKLNQQVEIEVEEGRFSRKYASFLVEDNRGTIIVAAPMLGNRVIALPSGTGVSVAFVDAGGVYGITASVIGYRSDVTPLLVLGNLGEVQRVQRRDFVRLKTHLPVTYQVYPGKAEAEAAEPSPGDGQEGKIKDISGGGLLLATTANLRSNEYLGMEFFLPDGYAFWVLGRVLRSIANGSGEKALGENWYGIQFSGVEPRAQDRLIRFIFEEQMRLRRKGLL